MSEKETLHEMSEEQDIVYQYINQGKNVIVDACAGSGKSTTILSIAQKMPNTTFLQITYNSMLRKEVKAKVKGLELENIKVQTFHSLCVKYYLLSAYTDTGIRYVLYNKLEPRLKIPEIQILVLDEAQDMTYLYFQFIVKYIKDSGSKNIQLLILGDYMQGLYEFKGSDIRFLTNASTIWEPLNQLKIQEFEKCTLRMSYRITKPMADFVNNIMLGETRLLACRDGEPVTYIRNSRYVLEKIVIIEIMNIIQNGGKPSDIFVLGASVKGITSHIRKMENILVENSIPCHVPMMENMDIDEKVIEGKVVFSTFHGVKGRQRKYVFVTNFDNTYMTFFGRDLNPNQCPNTLYVATTRATQGLYLLENDNSNTDRPLDFLKMNHFEMKNQNYIKFKGTPRGVFYEKNAEKRKTAGPVKHDVTPTNLISFLKESIIEEISPILDRIFVKISNETEEDLIDIPVLLRTRTGFYEDISDLNGIAIPCIYYDHIIKKFDETNTKTNNNILYETIQNSLLETRSNEYTYLKKIIAEELPEECNTISDYLYLANIYVAVQERLYFKLKQIERDEYEWLTQPIVDKCLSRFDEIIGQENPTKPPLIENMIIHHGMETETATLNAILLPHFQKNDENEENQEVLFRFSAKTDLITEKCVWELKCTSKITIEHLLQVVVYAWIWRNIYPEGEQGEQEQDKKEFKILNIKSGEILKLEATPEELTHIMVLLLQGKYGTYEKKTDEEFIEDCIKIV